MQHEQEGEGEETINQLPDHKELSEQIIGEAGGIFITGNDLVGAITDHG